MPLHRLNRIEIQGFRSFGVARQTPDLDPSIVVFWGGNSQGKTSFAEALEFLFSGQISRRELLASAKDEFTEALRNAHIKSTDPVTVEAHILCPDGTLRKLARTLVEDYRRGNPQGCKSELRIDGAVSNDNDIENVLGIRLSYPPLRAPVLSQHTLGYLFSASPADRAAYFRAILDTQDLEDFRSAVAALESRIVEPAFQELADLAEIEIVPALLLAASAVRSSKTLSQLTANLSKCAVELLNSISVTPGPALEDQVRQIEAELSARRNQTFPLELLRRSAFTPWTGSYDDVKNALARLIEESGKVDAETQRVLSLFKAALAIPAHPHGDSADCPLCGAVDTFGEERVSFIREKVRASDAFIQSGTDLTRALTTMNGQFESLERSAQGAAPKFMRAAPGKRREAGFTVAKIKALLADHVPIAPWLGKAGKLARADRAFFKAIGVAKSIVDEAVKDRSKQETFTRLEEALQALIAGQKQFVQCLAEYQEPATALGSALKDVVDRSADTKGWEPLARLAQNPPALWAALESLRAHNAKLKALKKAVRDIDAANGAVLDDKFAALSQEVRVWWDRLRPDETTFFSAVQRRGDKTRRTVDLKAGLSANEDKSNPKVRDAVAVFSQSQLHCLGLALFLAKAVQEKAGFVVLDDPVLTSDDDYRPNFVASVVEGLLDAGVQVIVCTQDHKSWKDIGDRWRHRGAMQYQLIRDDALTGTEIRGVTDDLATMIARAAPLARSNDPVNRKDGAKQIRQAIERFGKSILVKDRKSKGDAFASITDYDGKNFGDYSQQVMNLLTKDPSHPGKLRTAYTNVTPGPHDDTPPSSGELKVALGDLKKLKQDYLD